MTATLEELLDACSAIRNGGGRIQIDCIAGQPRAVISTFSGTMAYGRMVTREGRTPSDALRKALIEDERLGADVKRKYAAAEKLGPTDDFEGLL